MRYFKALVVVVVLLLVMVVPKSAQATVNDFTFTSFKAEYTLSRDDENRSTLQVKETVVAQFPNYNQNHGIERAIPNTYDNHPVSISNITVTKQDGSPWSFSSYQSNDNTVLRIGNSDTYVQGTQEYVIHYSLRDVTKNFPNGDEFFWDINGTDWLQPFSSVMATLHLDDSIASAYDGRLACYSGTAGSNSAQCSILQTDKNTLDVQSTAPLLPAENISMVVGFAPNTFAVYVSPPIPLWVWLFILIVVPVFYIALPIYVLMWAIRKWQKYGRDSISQSTIVPQYIPPKESSMPLNDVIIHTSMRTNAVSATIIDLAVRHFIKIYQTGDKDYEIEIIAPINSLQPEETHIIDMLFASQEQGARVTLKSLSSIYSKVSVLGKDVYDSAIARGLLINTKSIQKKMYIVGGVALFLGIISFNILLLIAALFAFAFAAHMPARSQKGVELKMYLDGTKMYMEVAESERLKTLQSPTGATKVDTSDAKQLVKLYERLLPLAMLYDIEKEWAKQFATLYTQDVQPDWFVGNYSAFSTGAFVSAINNFGTTATSTFSPPANSGSSGFSGGGSSGGGGGGGGGGGW